MVYKALYVSITITLMLFAQAQSECERLASHPEDPANPNNITGVAWNDIEESTALLACEVYIGQNPNLARAHYLYGRILLKIGDDQGGLSNYKRAADQDYAFAQYFLGIWYLKAGKGLSQDYTQVKEWLTRAAENGYPRAQYDLGRLYGGDMNLSGTLSDEIDSEYDAIQVFNTNSGTNNPDYDMAAFWFLQAAEQNHREAQAAIGDYYMQGYSQEFGKDGRLAVHWLTRASDAGSACATFTLGTAYERGIGVSVNYTKAYTLYVKANTLSQNDNNDNSYCRPYYFIAAYISRMYEEGKGVTKNERQVYYWNNIRGQRRQEDLQRKERQMRTGERRAGATSSVTISNNTNNTSSGASAPSYQIISSYPSSSIVDVRRMSGSGSVVHVIASCNGSNYGIATLDPDSAYGESITEIGNNSTALFVVQAPASHFPATLHVRCSTGTYEASIRLNESASWEVVFSGVE